VCLRGGSFWSGPTHLCTPEGVKKLDIQMLGFAPSPCPSPPIPRWGRGEEYTILNSLAPTVEGWFRIFSHLPPVEGTNFHGLW
jgi:hypothetical protein